MGLLQIDEKTLSAEIAKGLSKSYFRAEKDLNECYFKINQLMMEDHINVILKETMSQIKDKSTEEYTGPKGDWCDAEFC